MAATAVKPALQCAQQVVRVEQARGTGRCSLVQSAIDRAVADLCPRQLSGLVHFLLLEPAEGASISFNENSDPAVRHDLALAAERTGATPFARAATYGSRSLLIPVENGRLSRGTWQGFYLCDFTQGWNERSPQPFTLAVTALLSPACHVYKSTFMPPARGFHSMRETAARLLGSSGPANAPADGLACVMVRHCSASMAYVEDRRAVPLLEPALGVVVPDKWSGKYFEHTYEGWDDMPGHAKNALIGGPCALVPMTAGGRILLAESEDVALGEHRDDWGSGGRGVSCTRFPGCFRATETVPLPTAAAAEAVALPTESLRPKVAAGLAILRAPQLTCFVFAPAGTDPHALHSSLLSQRRTSDEYLAAAGALHADQCPALGAVLRGLLFGGGRTRIVPVRDSALWLPQGCALFAVSMTDKPLQQASVEVSWFGP
eukprot:TRINITY_DN6676_c0_g1_i1.p1 TRINITY_DN6676_c0_g1~~TRINITY_DN6676_c0_g1_i1.p1  ORF type:complete len:441 (+),score=123.24 TRINITY_DN6676_c0_g1_i1:29-1324(+)